MRLTNNNLDRTFYDKDAFYRHLVNHAVADVFRFVAAMPVPVRNDTAAAALR